jgi:hypothetical protein
VSSGVVRQFGHNSARSANRLAYGLYSAGVSDAQKRAVVDGVRLSLRTGAVRTV